MSIDKITKEHVIRAVSKIEDEQIVLKPSTRYDVIIEDKPYPPKEVMRIANLILAGFTIQDSFLHPIQKSRSDSRGEWGRG